MAEKRGNARSALIHFAGLNQMGPVAVTTRAAKAIRPFADDEMHQTISLYAKSMPELFDRHFGITDGL